MTGWSVGAPGVVVLPDGRSVRGRAMRAAMPGGPEPEFAVYLRGRRPSATPWPARWVCWPDFALPLRPAVAGAALREAFERAADERVEIACRGGVGRTGTALAVLAVLGGVEPAEAVGYVRATYHPHAVETAWQRWWIAGTAE